MICEIIIAIFAGFISGCILEILVNKIKERRNIES